MACWLPRDCAVYGPLEGYYRSRKTILSWAQMRTAQLLAPAHRLPTVHLPPLGRHPRGAARREWGVDCAVRHGEGACCGPSIVFAWRVRHGRSWQCGTIQLDCVLPGRLGASYIAPDGSRAVPLMIHHAVFGSLGRFIAV